MKIKQNKQYEFSLNNFYPKDPFYSTSFSLIYFFFYEAYKYIHQRGIHEYLAYLDFFSSDETEYFEMVCLSIDNSHDLVYLHQTESPKVDKSIEDLSFVEYCQKDLVSYIVLSKKNFYTIIFHWDECWKYSKEKPFLLLYQDDKDWFDIISFESQELMQKFIVDHTK